MCIRDRYKEWNYGTFAEGVTYIRLAAITLGIGSHSSRPTCILLHQSAEGLTRNVGNRGLHRQVNRRPSPGRHATWRAGLRLYKLQRAVMSPVDINIRTHWVAGRAKPGNVENKKVSESGHLYDGVRFT